MPERIQQRRVKGWRLPLGAKSVARSLDMPCHSTTLLELANA